MNYVAFDKSGSRIAEGILRDVAMAVKAAGTNQDGWTDALIFDSATGEVAEVDLRGTAGDVERRLTEPARGPGRPKLGVVPREVTLLPRHWEWLNAQPGGASVALRRLVEEARRSSQGADRIRLSREAAYRFMRTLAGNEPGFEEATRALFGGNRERFESEAKPWPADVREFAGRLAAEAFP